MSIFNNTALAQASSSQAVVKPPQQADQPVTHQFVNLELNESNNIHLIFNWIKTKLLPDVTFFISGGSVMKSHTGRPLDGSDIDLFFPNKDEFDKAHDIMIQLSFHKHSTGNSLTFSAVAGLQMGMPTNECSIQLIKHKFYDSPEMVLKSFDIGPCQITFDGESYLATRAYTQSIEENKIILTGTISPARLFKYMQLGFDPSVEAITSALLTSNSTLTPYEIDIHSTAYM